MRSLARIAERIAAAAQFVAAAMLVSIALINLANVVGRYVFASPIETAEELMLFLLIGAVFLSFVRVTHDAAHIRMDMLQRALAPWAGKALNVFADLVTMAVALILVVVATPLVLKLLEFDQRSDALGIPTAIPQAVVPVGFALSALLLAIRQFTKRR